MGMSMMSCFFDLWGILAENFSRVDHATCPGQKLLWHECWCTICL